jgi:DNA-binding response OmpR family regulator
MRSVLVVDDNDLVYDIISGGFSWQAGFTVAHAANGCAALVALEAGRHDLALIDVGLPGLSGISIARRAIELDVPTILMTGHDDLVGKAAGYPMLTKPFRVAELVARFEHVVAEAARLNHSMREEMARGARLVAEAREAHRPFSETWLRLRDILMR